MASLGKYLQTVAEGKKGLTFYKYSGYDKIIYKTVKKHRVTKLINDEVPDRVPIIILGGEFEQIGGKDETAGGNYQKVGTRDKQ